ncbi:hypothetical protein PIB30_075954 [Stylosanthes scabra]|uniref:Uncharacterized protein n=1 Tax=Stylosanthes scabra TaxID=79078 RepID=A0ABU6SQC4_9FABA|nr:hypothetical protein [Stylosanthes scabra]
MVQRDQANDAVEPLTCGIRLACLTWPKPNGLGRGEAFTHFLTLFMNIDSDEGENYLTYPLTGKENELPFVNSFTNPDPPIQAILDEYWSTILTARLLPVGLPGESNVALKKKVVSYSPQYVAHQFGLAQALPAPLFPDTDDQLVHYEVDDLKKLEQLLDRNHERIEEQFNHQSFPEIARCWQCTQTFTTWWSKYFKNHTRHIGPSFSNMILPTKTRDKTPSPTSGRQQDRGKAIALGSKKRNTRSHSRGPPFEKSFKTWRNLTHSCNCSCSEGNGRLNHNPRQARTPFSNRESSPIEADEEDTEGEEAPRQALFRTPTLVVTAPSSPEHAHSDEQSLDLFLSQAKQVYSSGGKVPLNRGTGSKEVAAEPEVGDAPPIPATLSRVAAKIMSLLGFPLEDLATDDKLKAELISMLTLSISLVTVSGLYSSDLLALAGQKKELDAVVEGWKLLCLRAVDCSEASVQISQVLDQGRKSEQEAVARVESLEVELAAAKEGLANIRSANEDLSGKLKLYEENKASLATMTFKAETDMGNARASFNAAEKKVESLDELRTRLKLSLDRFI